MTNIIFPAHLKLDILLQTLYYGVAKRQENVSMKIQMRFHKDIGSNLRVGNDFLATLQEYPD